MQNLDFRSMLFEAIRKLHHATRATGGNGLGAGGNDGVTLTVVDVHLGIVVIHIKRPPQTATFVGSIHFNQLYAGSSL